MPGKRLTIQQEQLYMSLRAAGKQQKLASAKSGFSERSGYNVEHNKHGDKKGRHWRTRKDPLDQVWDSELVPLLQNHPELSPITLLEYLQDKYSGNYPDSLQRTLQRRIKNWRGLYGPDKELIFRQVHPLGKLGISDFTELKGITITLHGIPYKHLIYHFRLACSGWSHAKAIEGGESFTALAEGLQEALWRLGGAPLEHRTDSLSAAFKNLTQAEQDDITTRYAALCKHYNMIATRNNRGVSNVDYRHVIHSLAKKPQAFRFSVLRDDLLPSPAYKEIWKYAEINLQGKAACKFIVGLLLLAFEYDCETRLGHTVLAQISQGKTPSLTQLQHQFGRNTKEFPIVSVNQHALASYNTLLTPEVYYGPC